MAEPLYFAALWPAPDESNNEALYGTSWSGICKDIKRYADDHVPLDGYVLRAFVQDANSDKPRRWMAVRNKDGRWSRFMRDL